MDRFTDRVALVTGAASGIGRATALRLAAEGAAVVAVDLAEDGLAETQALAEAQASDPKRFVTARCDVADEADATAAVALAVERFGQLDVLVNAAGILQFGHTHEFTLADWNRLFAVNITGTFLLCREAIPHLVATKGNIVNIGSTAAHAGQPWGGAYSATKGAVVAFTRSVAVDYAKQGLRCNSISPGAIATPIQNAFHVPEGADPTLIHRVMPLGPEGTSEGVAAAIAWMASDEARHLNGADVLFDGATLA
jgi:meso-butanediol dehydrogenase/(S,S)-butanediol dehydrogenase/diacetyl reductase